MKKIISTLVTLSILLQLMLICTVTAAETDTKEHLGVTGRAGFLTYLGIIPEEEDWEANNRAVTRGEFAYYTAYILNSGNIPEPTNNYFTDINSSTDYGKSSKFPCREGDCRWSRRSKLYAG